MLRPHISYWSKLSALSFIIPKGGRNIGVPNVVHRCLRRNMTTGWCRSLRSCASVDLDLVCISPSQVTPINFTTGELDPDLSYWQSNANTDASDKNPRKQLPLVDVAVPIHTTFDSVVDSRHDMWLQFGPTSEVKDAAQTTVPFLDAQEVFSKWELLSFSIFLFHHDLEFNISECWGWRAVKFACTSYAYTLVSKLLSLLIECKFWLSYLLAFRDTFYAYSGQSGSASPLLFSIEKIF